MAKIHTHYDNLKVARQAPQEVIRAAYKALSQKYHPDKNPGDEHAARIMAIVNTAYGTLSDPVRRKEHDDWIAAEEWEVAWVESTRAEEGRERARSDGPAAWDLHPVVAGVPYRPMRDPKWWCLLGASFAAGCAATVLLIEPPRVLPAALAWTGAGTGPATAPAAHGAEAGPEPRDRWAGGKLYPAQGAAGAAPDIKALAVTQLVVPARAPDCGAELRTLEAPNGELWPADSGYVEGYPVGNRGDEMEVLVDNRGNTSPVFVKVYDLDRSSNVRHAFVQAGATLTMDKLAAGKYEVRYQNIVIGGSKAECDSERKPALQQAAASQPDA
jgi:hypothetical protein